MVKWCQHGLLPTLETVFARLDQLQPLGYCNDGVVLEVGQGVTGFNAGDRVVYNGPPRLPEAVDDDTE